MAHVLDDVTPLTWRPASDDDLDALADLVTATNYVDEPAQVFGLEDIRDHFVSDDSPVARLVLGWEADAVVAFAWNTPAAPTLDPVQVRLGGGVHPAYRHQGIGRQVFAWQVHAAREDYVVAHLPGQGDLRLVAYADEKLASRRGLYVRNGLTERRWFLDLRCDLAEASDTLDAILAQPVPDGIRFVPWDDAYCESCREAHNAAFAELWRAQPVTEDAWHAQTRREAARPGWSWLAVDDDDQVVGYALNSDATSPGDGLEGWTDRLGVRPSHRGAGIATGLLARSLDSFRRGGAETGGLGLDTHGTEGLGLYRSVGYAATDTIIEYAADEAYDDLVTREDLAPGRRDGDR
ncbi:GNAT family N-acetyltransferase [Mariniluteicoccus flavus]